MLRLLFLLICLPLSALAQATATLVADVVEVAPSGTLTAQGNVQVFYGDTVLSAQAISYSANGDRLTIRGPIFIRAGDGVVLTADEATLDPQLRNGILRSARLVLDQQLQLAANQITRVDGRYSQLTRTAVTSCPVCGTRNPLWDIRASRIIHDEQERQLYFEDATFRVRGVPIFWVPRMRLPDPTLERATGLLIPSFRSTNRLGLGVRLPYFIRIGDSRDLTLTPFLSFETTTLEARYRQAFLTGDIELRGAISRDTIQPDVLRGYVFGEGAFQLDGDFKLRVDVESVSDSAYLLDYEISEKDRLDSALTLERVRQDTLIVLDLTFYQTLRDNETNATLPLTVANLSYEDRKEPDLIGGTLSLSSSLDAFERSENQPGENGRDVARIGGRMGWQNNWIAPGGLVVGAQTALALDYYFIGQDPAFENGFRSASSAVATLRWPLSRQTERALHIIEPIVALGWTGTSGIATPNEDSTLAELDEGNLFGLSRFPGEDAYEDGGRTSIGITWTRLAGSGAASTLTFGRIYQNERQNGFSPTSGLSGETSDWLLTGSIDTGDGLVFNARALFDTEWQFDKTETRLAWSTDTFDLAAAYHWLPEDPTRNRDTPSSEVSFDTSFQVNDRWQVSANGRYDIEAGTPASAGLGLLYRHECVTVDLSAARRYTSNTTAEPINSIGLSVNLTGFSAGRSTGPNPRACQN